LAGKSTSGSHQSLTRPGKEYHNSIFRSTPSLVQVLGYPKDEIEKFAASKISEMNGKGAWPGDNAIYNGPPM
jgi:hypothetical protein